MNLAFTLLGQRDPMRMLELFSCASREILKCDETLLALVNPGSRTCYVQGKENSKPLYEIPFPSLPVPDILELVVTGRSTLRRTGRSEKGQSDEQEQHPLHESYVVVPFATSDRVYGWFCIAGKQDKSPFRREDEDNALALATQAARAYENLLHTEGLSRRIAELEAINSDLEAFSYSVSHDLRAPLRSIDRFTRILSENLDDRLDRVSKDHFDRVLAASRKMSQLINALLAISRLTDRKMTDDPVDLSALAHVTAYELRKQDPERRVDFIIEDDIVVRGDRDMLGVVFENLFNNAWKFTARRSSARIEFGALRSMGETVYFVRDDGAGFDMNFADKLFLPFHRLHTEEEFSGLGIGLATVQRIISRHGGRIWAEGGVEKGAAIYFTLQVTDR